MAAKTTGPHLAAALFCERTLRDDDGALSAIKVFDQISVSLPSDTPEDVPSKEHPVVAQVSAMMVFKTGDAGGGKRMLRLVLRSPSGAKTEEFERKLSFSDLPNGGASIRLDIGVPITESGVHWIHAYLDNKLTARMPLNVIVKREAQINETIDAPKRKAAKKKTARKKNARRKK